MKKINKAKKNVSKFFSKDLIIIILLLLVFLFILSIIFKEDMSWL